jgi:hypothetical protein
LAFTSGLALFRCRWAQHADRRPWLLASTALQFFATTNHQVVSGQDQPRQIAHRSHFVAVSLAGQFDPSGFGSLCFGSFCFGSQGDLTRLMRGDLGGRRNRHG